ALLRAGRTADAADRLGSLRARAAPSPWIETLAAEISLARAYDAARGTRGARASPERVDVPG
ncbi:M48 family peptidase, partial [Enterococcus faecalis]